MADAANQTHLKLVIIDNQDGHVGAFIDFENNFGLDEFVSKMVKAIGHEPKGDFEAGVQHVMKSMTLQNLLALSALDFIGDS